MSCQAIDKLRSEAQELRRELQEKRDRARRLRSAERRCDDRRQNDFEEYLRRRIARNAAEIQRHLAQHGCQ